MTELPHNGKYAIIGAGPSGLAGARNLQRYNVPYVGFESHADVGGLRDIDNPRSTAYQSAHLISSKSTTEFSEFPMANDVSDYPSHNELRDYFCGFAQQFDLYSDYQFKTNVTHIRPENNGWRVQADNGASSRNSILL